MKKAIIIFSGVILVVSLSYYFFGQEHRYAKAIAQKLFEFPLPHETEVVEKKYDHGVFYGGGPWGSGGHPTVVAFMKLTSKLSEQEIFDHFNDNEYFEIYFSGREEVMKEHGKHGNYWYVGERATGENLSDQPNKGEPISFIVQFRSSFSYPFFIDFH